MSAPAPASRVLVVAGSAAESDELLEALVERSRSHAVELTLIVPTSSPSAGQAGPREEATAQAARRRLRGALARFRAAGLYVREAGVGEGDPILAVADAVAGGDVDEIVVATAPRRLRRRSLLGEQLRDATGLPVTQVVGRAAPEREARRAPSRAGARSRGQEHRRRRPTARRPAEPPRPSAAWVRSREPLPRLSPMAVVRLQLARGLAVMGFVLLALSVAGATNS